MSVPADRTSVMRALGVCFRIGTAALAVQVVGSNWPKPHYTLLITGLCRFQIVQLLKERPYPVAEVEQLDRLEEFPHSGRTREELGELSEQFYKYAVQVSRCAPARSEGRVAGRRSFGAALCPRDVTMRSVQVACLQDDT